MSKTQLENVVSHWHRLFEDLQTSPKDFYSDVELALDRRSIPGLKVKRVHWSEGGVLSPDREYLRVTGDRYAFDICAAPFGTGFFFSSWMTKKKARFVLLYALSFAVLTALIWAMLQWVILSTQRALPGWGGLLFGWGLGNPFVLVPLSFLTVLWLIAVAARAGNDDPEAAVVAIPGIGWFYEKVFAPATYYRIDTMLMFQSAVHSAMLGTIDGLLTKKGLRALREEERKPVLQEPAMDEEGRGREPSLLQAASGGGGA